ncbi:MAG: adenylyltransferase/cytidyltransferase family protein [Candidatus Lokiarchaeota archaeon]|nr:adenylyltransferase/cytidyltransferase family protein [Candidatus Lokiarchaeota archaeon]
MKNTTFQYDLGVIHGRFQVLHNDHIKYLMAGKELCKHLVVGITNPDPSLTRDSDANPHRSTSIANPLTYYERYLMIQAALLEQGLSLSEFSIVPLPINVPELIKYYVPLDAIFFLTIYDEWGQEKRKHFQELGLKIHVLWEVPLEKKGLSSSDIRKAMIHNRKWEHFLPISVVKFMNKWNIPKRLKEIYSKHQIN